jgi:hypothetical protein
LGLVSYGRDGEEIDSITRKKKPRIYVPPHSVFITAEREYEVSGLEAEVIKKTGFNTLLGELNIYRNKNKGGYIVLVGLNSSNQLEAIKDFIKDKVELLMVDGALDRRSSAMPDITEAFILSTGAVIANSEELVVDRTITELRKLSIPVIKERLLREYVLKLYANAQEGIVDSFNNLIALKSKTSLSVIDEISAYKGENIKAIILKGALINSLVEELIYKLNMRDIYLIVRDGTRVFLNKRNLNLLDRYNINLSVINAMELIAVTINPLSPYGVKLDSESLLDKLRKKLPGIPVYDLMGEEYLNIKG